MLFDLGRGHSKEAVTALGLGPEGRAPFAGCWLSQAPPSCSAFTGLSKDGRRMAATDL